MRYFKMNKKAKGFTILEVLIALLLLALGFISMLGLQLHSSQYSNMAYYRGIASQLANGIASSIRANPHGKSSYNLPYNPSAAINPVDCRTANCSSAQIAQADIAWARQSTKAQLPNGDISIVLVGTNHVDVALVWFDPDTKGDNPQLPCTGITAVPKAQCLSVRVRL